MGRLGFIYDQTRCIGCNACQMACKDKNNLESGLFFRRVETIEYTENGKDKCVHYSGACNHCEEAACVKSCPTGAMHYMEDGTVGHDSGKCVGCGTCTWACPYRAPKLSCRLGIARKCNSCMDLRRLGRNPACVDACLTHCLEFKDLELAESGENGKGGRLELVSELPFLPDASLTKPSLKIRRKE